MSGPAPTVLIYVRDDTAAGRWARLLREIAGEVWLGAEDLPDDAQIDVLLTDLPASDSRLSALAQRLTDGRTGLITLGSEEAGDVSLPADASDREIRLACVLLSRIVALEREHRRGSQALVELALTDPLTGLPNRRAWDAQLKAGLRAGTCLVIADVDYFKRVNDTSGHLVGDEVLRTVGRVLPGLLRRDDFVARLGGDEFGLLLANLDPPSTGSVVERVRISLVEQLRSHPVTLSAGYALYENDGVRDATSTFAAADRALNAAKQAGRDRTAWEH